MSDCETVVLTLTVHTVSVDRTVCRDVRMCRDVALHTLQTVCRDVRMCAESCQCFNNQMPILAQCSQ